MSDDTSVLMNTMFVLRIKRIIIKSSILFLLLFLFQLVLCVTAGPVLSGSDIPVHPVVSGISESSLLPGARSISDVQSAGYSVSEDRMVSEEKNHEYPLPVSLQKGKTLTRRESTPAPDISWEKCLGGTGNDFAYSVEPTSDGGYVVAGRSNSTDGNVTGNHGGSNDVWIVKVSSEGTIEWQKSLGGTNYDEGYSVHQTSDAGYIIAGETFSTDGDVSFNHGGGDYWIAKLYANGTIDWETSLGGSAEDYASAISQTNDGGYIVTGSTYSKNEDVTGNHGYSDYWVVKLKSDGSIDWKKALGGSMYDEAMSIEQTSDSGYIVGGFSLSNDGNVTGHHGAASVFDYWVVKLFNNGTIEWEKSLGGSGADRAYQVQERKEGGYIVAGYSKSNDGNVTGNHGDIDYWVVNLTADGTINREKSLGGTNQDNGRCIDQTSDGGYIFAGDSKSTDGNVTGNYGNADYWVVKLTPDGSIDWEQNFGGSSNEYAYSIRETGSGKYIVAGYTGSTDGNVTGTHGNFDYWIVKLAPPALEITGITPPSGQPGGIYTITITGTGFEPDSSIVSVSGTGVTVGTYGVRTSTLITCPFIIDADATPGNRTVTVTNPSDGGMCNGTFTITPAVDNPTITTVIPGSGYNSCPIPLVIRGSKFKTGATVTLANKKTTAKGTISSLISTQIKATFPITGIPAGTYNLTVRNSDGSSRTKTWAFVVKAAGPKPSVSKISPANGYNAADWPVTITGKNFRFGVTVYIIKGNQVKKATISQRITSQIKCTLPTNGARSGLWDVRVSNSDGTSVTKIRAFTVKAAGKKPTITSIKPNTGLSGKNTAVTVIGTNFRSGAIVQMVKGSTVKKATGMSISAKKISCTFLTKGAAIGKWNVKITNTDGTTVTKTNAFTVKRKATDGETGVVSEIVAIGPRSVSSSQVPSPDLSKNRGVSGNGMISGPEIPYVPDIITP